MESPCECGIEPPGSIVHESATSRRLKWDPLSHSRSRIWSWSMYALIMLHILTMCVVVVVDDLLISADTAPRICPRWKSIKCDGISIQNHIDDRRTVFYEPPIGFV